MNIYELINKNFLLLPNVKRYRQFQRVTKKGNPSIVNARKFWKISNETKALQLIDKIITPLEKIIYLYIPTH